MDFKHIIWDFDGTLFDTYPHTASAFRIILKKEYGVAENVLEIEAQMRISMSNAYEFYKDKYEIDEGFWRRFKDFSALYENQNAIPYNNILMLCRFIFSQGLSNYLYTDRNKGVLSLLQKHGLYELFADFVTEENGFADTPDPSALNYLKDRHNMDKNQTIYIGDGAADLLCARNAGIKFCFFTEDVNRKLDADYTVQNFSDLYYIINSALTKKINGNI